MRVLKWPITLASWAQKVGSGEVLHVGIDSKGRMMVWTWGAYQDDAIETREIEVFGTGHIVPPNYVHLGTVIDSRDFVWHIFEVK
jgi:hypothetical protein